MKNDIAPEQITLSLAAYKVIGYSVIKSWDNSIETVKMNSFCLDPKRIHNNDELNEAIKNSLDNVTVGCKPVLSAFVQIWGIYDRNVNFITNEFLLDEYYLEKEVGSAQYKELAEMSFYQHF